MNTHMAVLAADLGDVVIPTLIIAVCVLIILVSIIVRRRRGGEAAKDLAGWQKSHGRSVDQWLDAHEGTLQDLKEGDDPALDRKLVKAMSAAANDSPDPTLRQLLLDMQTTAAATRDALVHGNRLAAESAHVAYSNHRQGAIFRIQQLEQKPEKPASVSDPADGAP